jgi:hypothetical protein
MIPGIIWALIGYAVCEITNRGRLTTTIVTAAAGALGLGRGLVATQTGAARPFLVGLGLTAGLLLLLAAVVVIARRGTRRGPRGRRNRHGSAAIASTRYVLYTESSTEPTHRGKGRPDRIRLNRGGGPL